MSVTVYGASDDLIEVEGDIREEFNPDEDGGVLAFSDGTVLLVTYTKDGEWGIRILNGHTRDITIEHSDGPDSDRYSDRATIHEDIKWVVFGSRFERANAE